MPRTIFTADPNLLLRRSQERELAKSDVERGAGERTLESFSIGETSQIADSMSVPSSCSTTTTSIAPLKVAGFIEFHVLETEPPKLRTYCIALYRTCTAVDSSGRLRRMGKGRVSSRGQGRGRVESLTQAGKGGTDAIEGKEKLCGRSSWKPSLHRSGIRKKWRPERSGKSVM